MIGKTTNRFPKTRSRKNRSVFGRSAFMVLTIAFFAAGTLKADLINVTSVSDFVRIKDVNVPFAQTAHSSNLLGNALERTIGSGEFETGGYRSRQITSTSGTSLNVNWTVEIPATGSLGPDALARGKSTILFTATSDSAYTAAGDNLYGNGMINTLFNYKLRDLTNSVDLVEFTDGWSNGTPVNNTNGSLTGILVAGHQYSWTSDFVGQKYAAFSGHGFQADGVASLNLSAVPEPSCLGVLGCLAGCALLRRRRR